MSFHKLIRVILAVCFLAAILICLFMVAYRVNDRAKEETAVAVQDETDYNQDDTNYDEDDETPLDYDKDAKWREAPIFIEDIDPKTITTTAKLHEVFDRFMLYSIPTVEIVNLPADFAQNGDANLFIKAVLPLMMKENEKIAADRKFLSKIAVKINKDESLTPQETVRFEDLARKYDALGKKTAMGRLADLLDKVDVVPNSLAIAQMGIETNWGELNADSPFGQKGWKDGKYVYEKFKTLPEAVSSFMLEINSLPQYQNFRVQRRVYKKLRGYLGARLIDYMAPFAPEDASYMPRLKDAYRTYNLGPLDNALFWQ